MKNGETVDNPLAALMPDSGGGLARDLNLNPALTLPDYSRKNRQTGQMEYKYFKGIGDNNYYTKEAGFAKAQELYGKLPGMGKGPDDIKFEHHPLYDYQFGFRYGNKFYNSYNKAFKAKTNKDNKNKK